MQYENPFVKKPEEYKRDIFVLKHYLNDAAYYLSTSTGKPLEECQQYMRKVLGKGGEFEFKDPAVTCLVRGDNGDREKVETTLNRYLTDAIKEKELIAPTFTTYLHPTQKLSLLATYIDANVKARGVAKKAMFVAKAAGNKALESVKKIEQTGKKLANNAISGAHVSPSNPLYNPTGHSTLTSNCRTTSGYGNANNEKLLSGNRHFYNHHIVLNNIISVVNHTDYVQLKAVIDKYQIHYPTVEETLNCIRYSTDLYWWEKEYFQKISDLVYRLTDIQRAAFVYTGDMFQLMKLNSDLVRTFLRELSSKITGSIEAPESIIKGRSDATLNLAHQICTDETKGIGKDYTSIKGTPAFDTLALTALNIDTVIMKYSDLIISLWRTDNIPASVSYFPNSIRRAALTSDTDSTIFTVQDWVIWYKGRLSFDQEAISIAASVVYIAAASISHILAIMSANFGIETKRIHQIEMKNEFRFDVFVPTSAGKHYYAAIGCQEGNVFKEHEMEIKGVYLKSSNVPKALNDLGNEMMTRITETVMAGEQIHVTQYIKEIAEIERSIVSSIQRGEFTYLRTGSIKDLGSYTKEAEDSPYQNHVFWNEVFGPKYGEMPNPPYDTVKLSVNLENTLMLKKWVEGIQDKELSSRMASWMLRKDKKYITTMHVPVQILQSRGYPVELLNIIDYRKIVSDLCFMFYLILETLGVYASGDKVMKLCMDYYPEGSV